MVWRPSYPKELKIYVLTKKLHTNVYGFFIQNLEATNMSFNRWTDQLLYIQTTDYYSAKKKWVIKQWKDMENLIKSILLSERSQSTKTTYCMIPTIWHSGKRQNYGDCLKNWLWWLPVVRGQKDEYARDTKGFWGSETIFRNTAMVDICHYTFKAIKFVKTQT